MAYPSKAGTGVRNLVDFVLHLRDKITAIAAKPFGTVTVGGAAQPVFMENGEIKACTAYESATVLSAKSATQDASGNVIAETYTPLDLGTWSEE